MNLSNYEYRDGNLYRIKGGGGEKAGCLAGWITTCNGREYRKMSINKKIIYVHQAIFFYHHGYLPKYIDHIDGNSLNNKIENLREATQSQNLANSNFRKNNTSGFKGVVYRKDTKKWASQIMIDGKHKSLGCFTNKFDAYRAYVNGAKKYFGDFAHPCTEQANERMQVKATE